MCVVGDVVFVSWLGINGCRCYEELFIVRGMVVKMWEVYLLLCL